MDKRVDNTNLPFAPDENVMGLWEYVDFVEKPEYFTTDPVTWRGEGWIKQLEFLPEGGMHAAVGASGLEATSFTWTKDFILNKHDDTCSSYMIRTIGGSVYLFFEWKSGDYSYRGLQPWYYVFKKI